MPLTNTGDIVGPAAGHGCGVGAFNVIQIEHAEAIVTGAERAGAPVILQISENTVRYHGALEPILAASLSIARRAEVPVACRFVSATRVDALAVAVGTSHAMLTRDATLDFDLIERLHANVPVPLVLHGSSGVPDTDLARVVKAGITKINLATRLNSTFTKTVRARLADHPDTADTRRYLGPAREAVAAEVADLLAILNSVG